jgi:hypothetical protein
MQVFRAPRIIMLQGRAKHKDLDVWNLLLGENKFSNSFTSCLKMFYAKRVFLKQLHR